MKCSQLILAGVLAVSGTAVPAMASTVANGGLNLSPAVKTATALPYLSAATSVRDALSVDEDHDHVHGNQPADLTAEGMFQA
jgi:peptidoglycan hydrolase-like amidase